MIRNQDIEQEFFDALKLKEYISKITEKIKDLKFDINDFRKIDTFILQFFGDKSGELEVLFTRAFFLGEHISIDPEAILKELPPGNTRTQNQEALSYVKTRSAFHIQGATDATKTATRNILYKNIERKVGWKITAKELTEAIKEEGPIGRNWNRVAISETSAAINNGILGTMKSGEYVVGSGEKDACQYCKRDIINRVYKVGDPPKYTFDGLDPTSTAYKELAEHWDKYVWVGKSNFGRSPEPNKRTPDGPVKRLPHEMTAPTIPYHVECRCRWNRVVPTLVYVNDKGLFVPKRGNEAEWEKWYNKEIKARYE